MYDSDIDFLVNLGLFSIFFIFIAVIILAWVCQYIANSFFKKNHMIALSKNINSRKMVESHLVDKTANLGTLSFQDDNISVNLFLSGFGYIGHMSGTVSKNSNDQYIVNFQHRVTTSFMLNIFVVLRINPQSRIYHRGSEKPQNMSSFSENDLISQNIQKNRI